MRCKVFILAAAFSIAICLCAPGLRAADSNWIAATGDWSDASNWSAGLPVPDSNAYLQNDGTATITQAGAICWQLAVGGGGHSGTVNLVSGSLDTPWSQSIGNGGIGVFVQNGGQNTVSFGGWGTFGLGFSGGYGSYQLVGPGILLTDKEWIGGGDGAGTFTQADGNNTTGVVFLGYFARSSGIYQLGGAGCLTAKSEYIGIDGNGLFFQTGGVNNAGYLDIRWKGRYSLTGGTLRISSVKGSNGLLGLNGGSFLLGGEGQLYVDTETFSPEANGLFRQTGGLNSVGYMSILGMGGRYEMTGGTLQITRGFDIAGVLDLGGGTDLVRVEANSFVNLDGGQILGGGSTSLYLGENSVMIIPPSFDPNVRFGNVSGPGAFHTTGTKLVIPAGRSLYFDGSLDDPVECQGSLSGAITLNAGLWVAGNGNVNGGILTGSLRVSGNANVNLDALTGGLWVSENGNVNLGTDLCLDDANSLLNGGSVSLRSLYVGLSTVYSGGPRSFRMEGGSLNASASIFVGEMGSGTFTQSGGNNTVWHQTSPTTYDGILALGGELGDSGTYQLGGTGRLRAYCEVVGFGGMGSFLHVDGNNTVSTLIIGSDAGSSGSYQLSGGTLEADITYVGCGGTGVFTQTGGTHHVQQSLSIATESNAVGVYSLLGGTLFAGRIDVGGSPSGKGGLGTFAVSGGNAVVDSNLVVWSGSTVNLGLGTAVSSNASDPALDLFNDGLVEVGDSNGLPVVYCLGNVSGTGDIIIGSGATLWVESMGDNSYRVDAGARLVLASENPQVYATLARQNYDLAVPEPGSLAMVGLGCLWLASRRKRARRVLGLP